MDLPTLDLNNIDATDMDRACRDWGCFHLVGHGLPAQLRSDALLHCQQFFHRPTAHKNLIRRSASNAWGFYDAELTKNRRDWKEILDIGPAAQTGPMAGSSPQWPEIPGFRDVMIEISNHMHAIALQLVGAVTSALQSTVGLLHAFEQHTSFLRLNYFPPCPEAAPADTPELPATGHLGIAHHTDAGTLTVLLTDAQAGLQIRRAHRWHPVTPQTEALFINIGDIVQVWSNDRYRAPLHRVLANPRQERFSLPYFLNPAYQYDYAPLPDGLGSVSPPRYQRINWGDFRQRRSAGDYADLGEELQISNFAIAAGPV